VGDWGRGGQFHQQEVADRMGESAAALEARFVISVGDNFYDDGVTGLDDPAWKTSFEDVYRAPSLEVPWQVALGNHDYRGDDQAQLDYSMRSKRWRLPARWYDFHHTAPDGTSAAFFVIDTSPMINAYYDDGAKKVKVGPQKQNVPVQLAWLDRALAASKADWNIVVGHHPIRSGKIEKASQKLADGAVSGGYPELVAMLGPILKRHRVPLYFNGHNHELEHVVDEGTHYVCTGAGSKMAPECARAGNDFCSLESGFVACAVDRSRLRIGYRSDTGAELHVVDIARPA